MISSRPPIHVLGYPAEIQSFDYNSLKPPLFDLTFKRAAIPVTFMNPLSE
jgi:hypothetical protein